MVSILVEQIKKDQNLKNSILLQYGTEAADKTTYARMIQGILRAESDQGFLDYSASRRAAKRIMAFHDQSASLVAGGQTANAITILQAIIECVPDALYHADDSSGELSGCVAYAFMLLDEITPNLDAETRQKLFAYYLEQAFQEQYRGWDYPRQFLRMASELAVTKQEQESLFRALDRMAAEDGEAESRYFSEFRQAEMLAIKLDVMQRRGDGAEAVRAQLRANIHLSAIRERLVKLYIDDGALSAARELCLEGIEQYRETGLAGLVIRFQEYLLTIAEKADDRNAIVQLGQDLLLSTGDLTYFAKLKKRVAVGEWSTFLQQLLKSISDQAHQYIALQLTGDIYVREQMWDELLALCQRSSIDFVSRFDAQLAAHFPVELCTIYEKTIYEQMARASDRKGYRAICDYLRRIKKLGRLDQVQEIKATLKAEYARRPAMVDELNKV